MAMSRQNIEIPQPIYETIDRAVLSASLWKCCIVKACNIIIWFLNTLVDCPETSTSTAKLVKWVVLHVIDRPLISSVITLVKSQPPLPLRVSIINIKYVNWYYSNWLHTYPSCAKEKFQKAHLGLDGLVRLSCVYQKVINLLLYVMELTIEYWNTSVATSPAGRLLATLVTWLDSTTLTGRVSVSELLLCVKSIAYGSYKNQCTDIVNAINSIKLKLLTS